KISLSSHSSHRILGIPDQFSFLNSSFTCSKNKIHKVRDSTNSSHLSHFSQSISSTSRSSFLFHPGNLPRSSSLPVTSKTEDPTLEKRAIVFGPCSPRP
ncbi:hypothetical protein NDU88_004639, partial [Pleurodeles waltl]